MKGKSKPQRSESLIWWIKREEELKSKEIKVSIPTFFAHTKLSLWYLSFFFWMHGLSFWFEFISELPCFALSKAVSYVST